MIRAGLHVWEHTLEFGSIIGRERKGKGRRLDVRLLLSEGFHRPWIDIARRRELVQFLKCSKVQQTRAILDKHQSAARVSAARIVPKRVFHGLGFQFTTAALNSSIHSSSSVFR